MDLKRPLFWEIQQRQRRISLLILFFLFIFHLISLVLLTAIIFFGLGFFFPDFNFWQSPYFQRYFLLVSGLSIIITIINFLQTRKAGANFILHRLQAYPPQRDDRYHLAFKNVLEEMGLASGFPEIKGYIVPSPNINSFSLLDRDNRPAIGVTEGLIAEASRDELQAVVAHEVAHILRGDTFLLTLICSLANFYEQLLNSLEKEKEEASFDILRERYERKGIHPLLYLASFFSLALINFFSTLVSRQRELLADATAVEFCRDPMALARIIYKAQLANSYLGDFSLYTPLFLVPPDSREISDSFWSRLFNTHPPIMFRLKTLASMANKSWRDLVAEIREQEELRDKARVQMQSKEELAPFELSDNVLSELKFSGTEDSVWMVKTSSGKWVGPHTLNTLLALPVFTPGVRVKNIRENREGRAEDFDLIRAAISRLHQGLPVDAQRQNKCPQGEVKLAEAYYEGVKIKTCFNCQGKLVPLAAMERILARHEVGFSSRLKEKAEQVRKNLRFSTWLKKQIEAKSPGYCPQCGLQMVVKPYNYSYFLPVYKCLHCALIWFEADELEILQFLTEKRELLVEQN